MRRALIAALLAGGATGAGAESLLDQFSENAAFTAAAYWAAYPMDLGSSSRPQDDKDGQLWSRLTLKSRAFMGDTLSAKFEGHLGWTTHDGENNGYLHHPDDEDLRPASAEIDQLALTHEAERYALTVGKATVNVGLAEIYSPTNRFNNVNAAYPQHSTAAGIWQARLAWYLEEDTLSFLVSPYEEHGWLPHPSSRWYGSGDPSFYQLNIPAGFSIRDVTTPHTAENASYLMLYEGVREGYDFFLLAHHGPSIYPVLRAASGTAFEKEYPLAFSLGGGISMVDGAWKYYGEAIHQRTQSGADQDFLRYVVGLSYRETEFANRLGFNEIQPIIEYAGDRSTHEQDAGYFANSREARPGKDTLIARLQILHNERWSYSLHGTKNLSDEDYALGAGAEYKPNDNLRFTASVQFYGGDDDTQFGRWRANDNLELGVEYRF